MLNSIMYTRRIPCSTVHVGMLFAASLPKTQTPSPTLEFTQLRMSALGLLRSRTRLPLLSASVTAPRCVTHRRCFVIYRPLIVYPDNAKRVVECKRALEAVMADLKLHNLRKRRTSERLHALIDYHRAYSDIDTLEEKLLVYRQSNTEHKTEELTRAYKNGTREWLSQEEKIVILRSRACKLCLFAPLGEVGFSERVVRAADLIIVGWIDAPANRLALRIILWLWRLEGRGT
jgi:hypothetical protein